ncbi:hypothetical protein BC831DRAFT_472749 [Entophlyctis helioformis]|nr:hypothetical protein BC831DRAFT_472749 [Entophlyctis helioformis]
MVSIDPNASSLCQNGVDPDLHLKPLNVLIVTDGYSPLLTRLLCYIGSLRRCAQWRRETLAKMPPLLEIRDDPKGSCIIAGGGSRCKDGVLTVQLERIGSHGASTLQSYLNGPRVVRVGSGDSSLAVCPNFAVWAVSERGPAVFSEGSFSMTSRMDFVVNVCSSSNLVVDEALAQGIIDAEVGQVPAGDPDARQSQDQQTMAELADLIATASLLPVTLSQDCREFIARYVTLARKMFPEQPSSVLASVERLTRIAKAHAKLCLRHVAVVDDAAVAILLVEESMAFLSGVSVLGFKTLPQDMENLFALYGARCQSQTGPSSPSCHGTQDSESESQDGGDHDCAETPYIAARCFSRLFRHMTRLFDSLVPLPSDANSNADCAHVVPDIL